ncbi:MAG: cation:proton antiporter [Candidatus Marinimicrobia bacterium]|nr:cation:proton antiporter [Candidatus Neomarinimicrobiota bacterium]
MTPPDASTMTAFKELLVRHPLFLIGFLLIVGYHLGKLVARAGLPEITGLLLAGLLAGAFATEALHARINESVHIITEIAIGFLALSVGSEFSARKLKRIGRDVFVITGVQLALNGLLVYGAFVLISRVWPVLEVGFPYAILLAVMSCATAPAIILAEVHHLRARGRFIDYLFGLVALGDAVTVVVYGLAFTVVTNVLGLAAEPYAVLMQSLREVFLSLLCGGLGGGLLHLLTRRVKGHNELLIVTVGLVFVMTGLSIVLHLSPLLANMTMGAVLVNISHQNQRLFRPLEPLMPPIYALFFVIAGIELRPEVFLQRNVLLLGLFYVLVRGLGKIAGVRLGCAWRGLPPPLSRNLGWCMLSQGGIALGFVLLIQTSPALAGANLQEGVGRVFHMIVNIILLSVFLNELLSPFFIRRAILKGNDMEL